MNWPLTQQPRYRVRRASVTLELLVGLPILAIGLFAVVEFGVLMASISQVVHASREGAKAAAENMAMTANDVKMLVDTRLQSAGFGTAASSGITLQRKDAGGTVTTTKSPPMADCPTVTTPTQPNESARVTVCVPLIKLAPNVLASFGFTLSGKVAEATATFAQE